MTKQLSVAADPQADAAGAVSAVVASLPVSFAPAAGSPEVVAVAGHPGWTARAVDAIRSGAKGVVVSGAAAEDPARLSAAANAAEAVVVLDRRWAGNVALDAANAKVRSVISAALDDAVLLDSVAMAAPGTEPLHLLADQFAVLVQCGIEVRDVRMVQCNGNGYTVAAVFADGIPVALQGILTSVLPATASLTILTSTGRADVVLPDPAAAWPAEVRAVTAEGSTTLPTLYESSHRTTWSRVHAHLTARTAPDDLAQFATVLSLLSQLKR
jgi:hypothetical protein